EQVRLEGRTALLESVRIEDDDVRTGAPHEASAVGEADSLRGRAAQPVHGLGRVEQPLLAHHEPPEPGGPGVRAVEERPPQWAVRREGRRVRAWDAERVRERLALLLLAVGV